MSPTGSKMTNKKLQQIGGELSVSEKDVANIRKQAIKRKLLYPIISAITIACSSGIGFWAGTTNPIVTYPSGYPFVAPSLGLMAGLKRKRSVFILVTILLSVVGAVAAYKGGQHYSAYHAAIKYNVFSRRK
jgi:formate hydrogenlyase subunit 3/multisubunit Na+/H+ antiporter MnhD subunit